MALPNPAPDTHVLVTGASSGIGEAFARELAARGHGLTIVARRQEVLETLAGELEAEHGVSVAVHAADLADERERAAFVARVRRDRRRLVGLVNNAGVGVFGRVADHTIEEEQRVVRLNLLALHDLCLTFLPGLVEQGEGAICNVSSVLAFAPIPQNATYAATKAFATSFSEALHTELIGTGVSCTAVHPGPTKTAVFDASGAPGAAGLGPDVFWQEGSDVARGGVRAMEQGSRTTVPGLTNKAIAFGLRTSLRTTFLPVARAAQSLPVRRALGITNENGAPP
jgi:hypothetical protein